MKQITISETDAGQRFDKYLSKLLPYAGKSFVYKMLRKKNIVLNGKKSDGSDKIQAGDVVKVFFTDETFEKFSGRQTKAVENNFDKALKQCEKPDIIYEDENIIAVNKPAGILSQKADAQDVSINEIICDYLKDKVDSKTFKPGICNRLDRNTSGIVIAGKTMYGLQSMSAAFHDRTVKKYYICVVKGKFNKKMRLNGYIKKDEASNKVTIISDEKFSALTSEKKDGYAAVDTEFIPVCFNDDISFVKVHLITGKTHQIRAHLQFAGFPIAGDRKYGDARFNDYVGKKYGIKSQMLHAYELIIPEAAYSAHKGGLKIKTPVPERFCQVLRGENLWQPGTQGVLEALH